MFHKSLVTGNVFPYDEYSAIEEEKWWPPTGDDSKLYLPLPKDEYPYTIVYSRDQEPSPELVRMSFDEAWWNGMWKL